MQTYFHIHGGVVQVFGGYTLQLHLMILLGIVGVATAFDIHKHRIPNWLIAVGLLISVPYHSLAPFGSGATFALTGLLVGISALIPLYAMGTMGAGDVKLMGMVGSYLGATATLSTVLATLIAGGVLALLASIYKRALGQLVSNLHTILIQRHIRQIGGALAESLSPPPSVGKLPYAVAIAAGTGIQIFIMRT